MSEVKTRQTLWLVMRLRPWTELRVAGEGVSPNQVTGMPGVGFMSVHGDRDEALAQYDDGRVIEIQVLEEDDG